MIGDAGEPNECALSGGWPARTVLLTGRVRAPSESENSSSGRKWMSETVSGIECPGEGGSPSAPEPEPEPFGPCDCIGYGKDGDEPERRRECEPARKGIGSALRADALEPEPVCEWRACREACVRRLAEETEDAKSRKECTAARVCEMAAVGGGAVPVDGSPALLGGRPSKLTAKGLARGKVR